MRQPTLLVGLNMYTGAQELNQDVDPPGSLRRRTCCNEQGLNLDGGNVIFGFGGNQGDCEPYQRLDHSRSQRAAAQPTQYDNHGHHPQ